MINEADEKNIESTNSPTKKVAESGMADLAVDISEVGFDRLLKDIQGDTIGQIPFVKAVYSLAKAGYAIKDFFFRKKLLRFVAGFRDADKFVKEKIEQALPEQQDKQEMGEHLIVALQRFDQITKADALCKLFLARINGEVTHREFLQYTLVLDRIDFNDLDILKTFYESGHANKEQNDVLRSFAFTKIVSVDYSGRPEVGKIYPRSGGGDEKFIRNGFGEKFMKALGLL
jgi:hypothetical protein